MKKIFLILTTAAAALATFTRCEDATIPEPKVLVKPHTYNEQYYANLREYKASPHQIAFGWFSDYKSHSLGTRFAGIPDSMDIISVWGGIPGIDPGDVNSYNPLAYEEMRFMQKVKGTRIVVTTIIRIRNYATQIGLIDPSNPLSDPDWAQKFGDYLLAQMWDNDLDGIDLDYEPEGDPLSGEYLTTFVQYLAQHVGPMSPNPDKLLMIDFYSNTPSRNTEPYANYFIRQAYSQGFSEHSETRLQGYYNNMSWCPTHKFIVTENIGDWWQNGGSPFHRADGTLMKHEDGSQVYSLEGMASWNPTQGPKGGFGGFYMQREYNSNPPYKHMRRAIQAQNPAIVK